MKRQTLIHKLIVLVTLTALLLSSTPVSARSFLSKPSLEEVRQLLLEYSTALSSSQSIESNSFSQAMQRLIDERKTYYTEFFQTGLHSELININSEFVFSLMKEPVATPNGFEIKAVELVKFKGRYIANSPEDSPLIRAARLALSSTDKDTVRMALEDYIWNHSQQLKESSTDGFETMFVIEHKLLIQASSEQWQIVEDTFTDKAIDNPSGFDNVYWVDGSYARIRPDWQQMPNYSMYTTPIEELAKALLDDFIMAYENKEITTPETTLGSYRRSTAHTYADKYTSNPTTTGTCNGYSVYRKDSVWNPNYSKYNCDCANFVSQALRAGGIPTDGTWYKDSNAWKVSNDLYRWITNKGYAVKVTSIWSLSEGDIAFITDYTHVVMVANHYAYPYLYDGHTNDRKDYVWSSSLTQYVKIVY